MTLGELKTLLDTTELKVAYHHWKAGGAPPLPYILYYEDSDLGFKADNVNYMPVKSTTIELYSQTKDVANEAKIEQILADNKLSYEAYESYLETEDMYLRAYEITL
ncbi:MAG: hypothetical protein ACK5MN_03425 [Lachnospiraceae bacterium]